MLIDKVDSTRWQLIRDKKNLYPHYRFHVCIDGHSSEVLSTPLQLVSPLTLTIKTEVALPSSQACHLQCPINSIAAIAQASAHRPKALQHAMISNNKARFCSVPLQQSLKVALPGQEIFHSSHTQPAPQLLMTPNIDNDQQTDDVFVLAPPVMINLRFDAKAEQDKTVRTQLSDQELQYFSTKNNRITFFIHGFNVDIGQFPSYDNGQARTVQTADDHGQGAHQWLLELEHVLNTAAGFDHDYRRFTRLAVIAWSGDTAFFDFHQSMENALQTAEKLMHLIEDTHQRAPQLAIHIIAHSQGNGVLVKALDLLGQKNLCLIEHVFLWQAAIPEDSLSSRNITQRFQDLTKQQKQFIHQQQQQNPWFLPFAHKASRQFTVLYSENDNILGPIPTHQTIQDSVNQQKPMDELVLATFMTELGLDSIYALAIQLGMSSSLLLDPAQHRQVFLNWRKNFSKTATDKLGYRLQDSLSDQTVLYRKHQINRHARQLFYQRYRRAIEQVDKRLQQAGYSPRSISEWLARKALHKHAPMLFNALQMIFSGLKTAFPFHYDLLFKQQDTVPPDTWLEELFTLLTVLTHTSTYWPKPAMGYRGILSPDVAITQLIAQQRLRQINQSASLWSHSLMKQATQELIDDVIAPHVVKAIGFVTD